MIHIRGSVSALDEWIGSCIQTAAQAVFDEQNVDPASEMTVALVDDEEIQRLNKQFLRIDSPTDVLSFPANEIDPETGALYLGDVIISLPRARTQAELGGHTLDAELRLLTVHGVLHLLGFDHASLAQKNEMWRIQATILQKVGNPITEPGKSSVEETDDPE